MKTLNRMRTAGVLTVGIGMSALAACANEAMPLDGASGDTEETGGSCGCWDSDAAGGSSGSSGHGGQAGSAGSSGTSGSSGSAGSSGNAGSSASGGGAGTGGSSWGCAVIDCGTGYECVQDGVDHYRCIRDGDSGGTGGGTSAGGSAGQGGQAGTAGTGGSGGTPPVDGGNQCVAADPVPCKSGEYGCTGTVFPSNQYCDVPGSNPTVKLGCQCPNPNDNDLGTWLPLGVGCASVNLCWK